MKKYHTTLGVMFLSLIVSGCGTSEYESRLDKKINEIESGSKFNLLASATEISGTSVSIRIPKGSENQPKWTFNALTEGATIDDKVVDSKRLKPGLIDIPDLKATYEGLLEDKEGGKYSFYLYVAVSTSPNRVNFPKIWRDTLQEKFPNTTELKEFQAQTPEGRSVEWRMCRANGDQNFYYVQPNNKGWLDRPMQGTVEMFFHDNGTVLVTLIWRLPTDIEQSIEYSNLKSMVAGCVKIAQHE